VDDGVFRHLHVLVLRHACSFYVKIHCDPVLRIKTHIHRAVHKSVDKNKNVCCVLNYPFSDKYLAVKRADSFWFRYQFNAALSCGDY
jgi:hypothetical protein